MKVFLTTYSTTPSPCQRPWQNSPLYVDVAVVATQRPWGWPLSNVPVMVEPSLNVTVPSPLRSSLEYSPAYLPVGGMQ